MIKNPTSEATVLQEIFELAMEWLEDSRKPETPVVEHRSPQELTEAMNLRLPSEGSGDQGMLEEVRTYLTHAVKTANPAYMNQLFGGFGFPGFIGEVITALTNTSMYTYEVAPAATLIEQALVEKMISYTGWETGNGIFTSGGSNSNLYAMILARNTIFPGAKDEGVTGLAKPAILVSEHSHFSLLKGANTIGIGHRGVRKVKTDDRGRMHGDELEAEIKRTLSDGFIPFMICSTAGTTETGSFDAIAEIAEVAENHELWHHVDGSWGGSLILCPEYRELFKGLDKADSFTWNPHKLMSIPLVCSAFMVKYEGALRRELMTHEADYIYHDYEGADYDTGPASLACGRRVDALKLWLSWKYWGDSGYQKRVAKCMELARYATDWVMGSDKLRLMFPTQTLNVNFAFKTPTGINSDEFNKELRYSLIETGRAMVNYCSLDEGLSIRLVLLNPDLDHSDLDRFFNRFISQGEALLQRFRG
jgi:glutamate/tyrosine decarboxylase-like PLP-dependent enzyme